MRFQVLPTSQRPGFGHSRDAAYLIEDRWDDFGYKTLYQLHYLDGSGRSHRIGGVKIGGLGWGDEPRSTGLSGLFMQVPDDYFSVGQDEDYYTALRKLPHGVGEGILRALRDFAFDNEIFARARQENVTQTSLLRQVSAAAVVGHLHRVAHGLTPLTEYRFSYELPHAGGDARKLDFTVLPDSYPPTNLHVVIGRNGAGKTRALDGMARALVEPDDELDHVGRFLIGGDERGPTGDDFASVVSVSFSAFDPFLPLGEEATRNKEIKYAYVGLKEQGSPPDTGLKGPHRLAEDFASSLRNCLTGSRRRRWVSAIRALESDPNFRDANLRELGASDPETLDGDPDEIVSEAGEIFARLSSGHSIVLLTITRLVEKVEERTLVLMDEPEAHLHPPLLSAFLRALSDLLIDRNGVAVIATHSPVVLQEVPKTCVWKLDRSGDAVAVSRPETETFGENVGTLTREIFGLEVTDTGFYRMVRERAEQATRYSEVSAEFDDQLGGEAMALLRAYLAVRRERDGDE